MKAVHPIHLEDYFRFTGIWDHGMFLHASAVQTPIGALVLMGPSNAGKTTLARMLSPVFPMIDNDTVYLRRHADGQFGVVSGQIQHSIVQNIGRCAGRPDVKQENTEPLAAMWRVFKSANTVLNDVSVYYQFKYLMSGIFEVAIQNNVVAPDLEKRWFKMAHELVQYFSVREFQFSKELCTIECVKRIFNNSRGGRQ